LATRPVTKPYGPHQVLHGIDMAAARRHRPALLTRPRALLLDEVTSALDPELMGEVLEVIRELKEEGMTMLIATHEMGFARDVADQVCFLEGGRILERGAPEQIFAAPEREETRRFLARLPAGNPAS
jgi:polar amino acid transport system ATP-binding protein